MEIRITQNPSNFYWTYAIDVPMSEVYRMKSDIERFVTEQLADVVMRQLREEYFSTDKLSEIVTKEVKKIVVERLSVEIEERVEDFFG